MSDYLCPFCSLNHGPDPRAHRSPCPQVRALKFDSDGTILAFKLRGTKGWQHKSLMLKAYAGLDAYVKTGMNTAAIVADDDDTRIVPSPPKPIEHPLTR